MPLPSTAIHRARPNREERRRKLGRWLEHVFHQYHEPDAIGLDPLGWARRFDRPDDREVAAFLAATLAYGNVVQIHRTLEDLFGRLGPSPARFAHEFIPGRSDRALEGFHHRFHRACDLAALIHLIGQMLRGWGSIENFWQAGDGIEAGGDVTRRAGNFVRRALGLDLEPFRRWLGDPPRASFLHLLPRADGPSACKRLHLFLRWMVRPDDGLDLGLWRCESPAQLLYPVDTHILRVGRLLRATRRRQADARSRDEITAFFRRFDPDDPVRFDFSLCRLGMLHPGPRLKALLP